MTRLTFNQLSTEFTEQGYTIHKLSKGYECFVLGTQHKFTTLQLASDWLKSQKPVSKVAEVAEVVEVSELAPVAEVIEVAEVEEVNQELAPIAEVAEVVAEATDTYWLTWNAAYYRALDVLATKKRYSELEQFQDKWNSMMNSKTQKAALINHGQVGLVVVLMMIEFLKLTAILISFTLAFTYPLIRRIAINHALIFDSFKSAVNVARRTLQTA